MADALQLQGDANKHTRASQFLQRCFRNLYFVQPGVQWLASGPRWRSGGGQRIQQP